MSAPALHPRSLALIAEAYLRIESARLYGLVSGGPDIDVEACEELIAQGRAAGVSYGPDDIDAVLAELLVHYARVGETAA